VLQTLGVSAILSAGGIFALCVFLWSQDDPHLEEIRNRPSAVEWFKESSAQGRDLAGGGTAPLIVQAEAFARYLNPSKSPNEPLTPVLTASTPPPVPGIRPAAPSVKFRPRGTSYHANRPGRTVSSSPAGIDLHGAYLIPRTSAME